MPVLDNPVNTRLEIIKLVYNLSGKEKEKPVRFFAAQIDGGYYSEIHHQLKFLKERGLVEYKRNIISKRFTVELTSSGYNFIDEAYRVLRANKPEKDQILDELFKQIRL